MTQTRVYHFRLTESDADLIELLESAEPGLRSRTIRRLLRRAIRQERQEREERGGNGAVDLAEIRAIVREEVARALAQMQGGKTGNG